MKMQLKWTYQDSGCDKGHKHEERIGATHSKESEIN